MHVHGIYSIHKYWKIIANNISLSFGCIWLRLVISTFSFSFRLLHIMYARIAHILWLTRAETPTYYQHFGTILCRISIGPIGPACSPNLGYWKSQHCCVCVKINLLIFSQSQFLRRAESIYDELQCTQLLNSELQRRALNNCMENILVCRARSLFCVFRMVEGIGGDDHSALILRKYNNALNCFEGTIEIETGDIFEPGILLRKNKILILGGLGGSCYLKSVRNVKIENTTYFSI